MAEPPLGHDNQDVRMERLDSVAALLGAGVSVGAGLPTGYQLFDELVDQLIRSKWAASELKNLARTARPDMDDEHDAIRLETLLLWVADVFDEELGFFDFLDSYQRPAILHLAFAQAALKGAAVITTNFDDLLERAIAMSGGVARTVDAHSSRARLDDIPIIKLHGTWRTHSDSHIRRSRSPLHATIERIAAANPEAVLDDRALRLLLDTVEGRHLIVAGYSASDDLDVVPALRQSKPEHVTWIDHQDFAPRQTPLDKADVTSWTTLLDHWANAGVQVTLWQGRTNEVTTQLGLAPLVSPPQPLPPGEWRKAVRRWAEGVRWNDPTGLGTAGLLFGEMRRDELAERAFRQSRGSRRHPNAGWTAVRRKYEIAQFELLKQRSDPELAGRLARQSRVEALRVGDGTMALFSLVLMGRASFLQQAWIEAERIFNDAAEEAQTDRHRAYALSWLGRTRVWAGEAEFAREPLSRSAREMRRTGNLEGLLDVLDGLGLAEMLTGRMPAARKHLEEALSIAESLGFVDRKLTLETSLAEEAFAKGDLDEAVRRVNLAIALPELDHDEISVTWSVLADIKLEQGRIPEALTAIENALNTLTIVTRETESSFLDLKSEILYRVGRLTEAQRFAERALVNAGSLSGIHAHAVLVALGAEDQTSLDVRLRNSTVTKSFPDAVAIAVTLTRLSIKSKAASKMVAIGRTRAIRMGAARWVSRLSS